MSNKYLPKYLFMTLEQYQQEITPLIVEFKIFLNESNCFVLTNGIYIRSFAELTKNANESTYDRYRRIFRHRTNPTKENLIKRDEIEKKFETVFGLDILTVDIWKDEQTHIRLVKRRKYGYMVDTGQISAKTAKAVFDSLGLKTLKKWNN